eukprot:scaffold157753_cov34-Prasinocladus_malaysianus.AAC.1
MDRNEQINSTASAVKMHSPRDRSTGLETKKSTRGPAENLPKHDALSKGNKTNQLLATSYPVLVAGRNSQQTAYGYRTIPYQQIIDHPDARVLLSTQAGTRTRTGNVIALDNYEYVPQGLSLSDLRIG